MDGKNYVPMAAYNPSINDMGSTDFPVSQDSMFETLQSFTGAEKRLLGCTFDWFSWDRYQQNEY